MAILYYPCNFKRRLAIEVERHLNVPNLPPLPPRETE